VLALGCAPLAGLYTEVDENQAHATVHAALDRGWRLFDTAPHYGVGLSEERLGRALRGVSRDRFEVQTKVGRVLVDGADASSIFASTPARHSEFDFSRDGILRSFESSLSRLQLDRVDSLLLHDPDDHWQQAIDEAYPTLAELRSQGVVARIGVGMNHSEPLARFARETDLDVFMIAGQLTLLDDRAIDVLLPATSGRTVLAAAVFNSGVLAGGDTFFYGDIPAWVRDKVAALDAICARFDVPLAAAALQYPLVRLTAGTARRRADVHGVVVGARSPEEVDEDHRLVRLPLPPELWRELGFAGLVRS